MNIQHSFQLRADTNLSFARELSNYFHLSVFATKNYFSANISLICLQKLFLGKYFTYLYLPKSYFSANIKLFHAQTFETASIKYLIALNHLRIRMMNVVPFQFEQQCKNQIWGLHQSYKSHFQKIVNEFGIKILANLRLFAGKSELTNSKSLLRESCGFPLSRD